jgi:hypothetical protein
MSFRLTGHDFGNWVIRLTLSGSYQRAAGLFIRPTLIAILFALVQVWRAAAADHSP